MRRLRLAALACCVVALAGCARSAQADLNAALSDVTDAANAGDAPRLRSAVDALLNVVSSQSGQDLTLDKATRIRTLAEKIKVESTLLDAPSPTPSRTPTPSPTPSATPTPTPTPSPTPSPTPTPTPTPSPTPKVTPSPTPVGPAADSASPTGSPAPP